MMTRTPSRIFRAAPLAGLLLGLAALWSSAAEPVSISWYSVVSGGGSASSAELALEGTAGQPTAGGLSSVDLRLGAGYWGDTSAPVAPPEGIGIFLPLIRRS